VTVIKIELFDYFLLNQGYTYRQVWKPARPEA
jgi:hypothetical protein